MVQAAYNYSNTFPARPLEQPERQERRLKKVRRRKNLRERVVVKTGLFIFCYALLLVFLCSTGSTLNYQVQGLEKDIENLQTSNARLEYEIAQGTSLDQIEKAAGTELGMHKADLAGSMVASVAAVEPVKPAAQAQVQAPAQDTKKQGAMEEIYNALLTLADKGK